MEFDLRVSDEYIWNNELEIRIAVKQYLNDLMLCPNCKLQITFKGNSISTNYYTCPMHSDQHHKTIILMSYGHPMIQSFIDDYITWVYKQGVS